MLEKAGRIMTNVEHAEVLIGRALALKNRSKAAKRARNALLLSAMQKLQVAIIMDRGDRPLE